MSIRVENGHVWVSAEIPVFIGTTCISGSFPEPGEPMKNFYFIPIKGTSGTLVFDRPKEQLRKPLTPSFLQFWHESDKLVVKSGLHDKLLLLRYQSHPEVGLHIHVDYAWYYTGSYDKSRQGVCSLRKVNIIDLLKYLEKKIDIKQLKERSTEE